MKSRILRLVYRLLAVLFATGCPSSPEWPKLVECAKVQETGPEVLQVLLDGGDRAAWEEVGKRRGLDALACGTQWAIDELSKPGVSPEGSKARANAVAFLESTGTEIR